MNIIGLLSWHQESPTWLGAAVASWSRFGITHLVACDGGYELFPEAQRRSGAEEPDAIYQIVNALGIGSLIYIPPRLWKDEVEKRNFMFTLAETLVEDPERDWYAIFDADEVLSDTGGDVRKILRKTKHDVAEFTMWQTYDPFSFGQEGSHSTLPRVTEQRHRHIFRAIPGLRWVDNHYTAKTPDGRILRGNANNVQLDEAEQIHGVRVEHRTALRDNSRRMQSYTYYARRREQGLERATCAFCEQPSIIDLPWDIQPSESAKGLVYCYVEVCADHVLDVRKEGVARYKKHGYDPAGVVLLMREHAKRAGFNPDDLGLKV